LNDVREIAQMDPFRLEEISAPALVIHGDGDTIVPFEQGAWSGRTISNAEFIPIQGGQHFCAITHHEVVKPAVIAFLKANAPTPGVNAS
jgi:pimeloyl-ACP methyl ester carboxylesterase